MRTIMRMKMEKMKVKNLQRNKVFQKVVLREWKQTTPHRMNKKET